MDYTPEQLVAKAKTALIDLFHRWRTVEDEKESARLWLLVEEMERRVILCQERAGLLKKHECPKCVSNCLVEFINDDGEVAGVCRKCGWTSRDNLLHVIRQYASFGYGRGNKSKKYYKHKIGSWESRRAAKQLQSPL